MSQANLAPRKVDQTGIRVGQAITILGLIIAFILSSWVLVAFVGISQLLGALNVSFAPYRLIYQRLLAPTGRVTPNIITDNPEPHRFAMLVGALFNGVATLALLGGSQVLGWTLVWIVIALANLNYWLNFCAGCWMYYLLNRAGVPGFTVARIESAS